MFAASQMNPAVTEAVNFNEAKTIGEQPAILSNLALANQIFVNNLQQQLALGQVQAVNIVLLASVAKCVSLITSSGRVGPETSQALGEVMKVLREMNDLSKKIGDRLPGPANAATA
jgi:hypothetical protein